LFLPAILPPPRREGGPGRAIVAARAAVLAFPAVSLAVVFAGLANRYYEPAMRWLF